MPGSDKEDPSDPPPKRSNHLVLSSGGKRKNRIDEAEVVGRGSKRVKTEINATASKENSKKNRKH